MATRVCRWLPNPLDALLFILFGDAQEEGFEANARSAQYLHIYVGEDAVAYMNAANYAFLHMAFMGRKDQCSRALSKLQHRIEAFALKVLGDEDGRWVGTLIFA